MKSASPPAGPAPSLIPPPEVLAFLKKYRRYLILGHQDPDGDCLGSELGIARLLEKRGAEAVLYSPGPFRRPEILDYAPLFQNRISADLREEALGAGDTAVLIMDCSTLERIGQDLEKDIRGFPVGVIDHHASGDDFGVCRWIEPRAASVTFMVHQLFKALEIPLDREAAEVLFLGLSTDTGFFRHMETGSAEVFRTAADLTDAGASPKKIFQQMHGNRSLESRILLGTLMARTEAYCQGALLVTWETLEDLERFGHDNRDSDTLYQQLQGIRGCEMVVLVREESEGFCSAGLRSNQRVDVGALAQSQGGGGHPRAAGFNSTLPRRELIEWLVARAEELL
jgi:bifunctional oligoribonuclease and PAP phosphatase NrnA